MRIATLLAACMALSSCARDTPPYVGQWRLNEDKTDRGLAFAFAPTASGDLQLTEGGRTYLVRFDGKDYPHPLGGVVRWMRLDDRSWETVYALNGRVVGQASYQLSDDGQRLTTRQKIGDRTAVYRRRSGERQGLTGEWSLTSASVTTVAIESA